MDTDPPTPAPDSSATTARRLLARWSRRAAGRDRVHRGRVRPPAPGRLPRRPAARRRDGRPGRRRRVLGHRPVALAAHAGHGRGPRPPGGRAARQHRGDLRDGLGPGARRRLRAHRRRARSPPRLAGLAAGRAVERDRDADRPVRHRRRPGAVHDRPAARPRARDPVVGQRRLRRAHHRAPAGGQRAGVGRAGRRPDGGGGQRAPPAVARPERLRRHPRARRDRRGPLRQRERPAVARPGAGRHDRHAGPPAHPPRGPRRHLRRVRGDARRPRFAAPHGAAGLPRRRLVPLVRHRRPQPARRPGRRRRRREHARDHRAPSLPGPPGPHRVPRLAHGPGQPTGVPRAPGHRPGHAGSPASGSPSSSATSTGSSS